MVTKQLEVKSSEEARAIVEKLWPSLRQDGASNFGLVGTPPSARVLVHVKNLGKSDDKLHPGILIANESGEPTGLYFECWTEACEGSGENEYWTYNFDGSAGPGGFIPT